MASAETFRVSGNGKKEVAEKRISEPHRDNRGLNSHLNASEVALAAITADGRLLTRALPATESSRMRRISPSLPSFSSSSPTFLRTPASHPTERTTLVTKRPPIYPSNSDDRRNIYIYIYKSLIFDLRVNLACF